MNTGARERSALGPETERGSVTTLDDAEATQQQDGGRGGQALASLLHLAHAGENRYSARGRTDSTERAFGGAVVAQALLAAGGTVPADRRVHSIHAHFLRPSDASAPTHYQVTAVRDGGSYTIRHVTAEQRDSVMLLLTASFQAPEDGWEHQVPQLDAPPPESASTPAEAMAVTDGPLRSWFERLPLRHPFDLRFAAELPRIAAGRGESAAPRQRLWLRCRETLPDEPLVHAGALAYASDMLLLSTALAPHARMIGAPDVVSASLDHAVWFHAPVRADEWLFYDQESSWAASGRALCQGRMYDRSGRLVLTVVQEGMIRRRAAPR
jgi:acyl-CoA thioesterase-2